VDIYLEAINRYENNYLNTAQETLEYIAPLDASHVKVHLDTFHMNIEEANMRKAVLSCGDRLGYFHVADNNRYYPGAGAIDFGAVLAALDEAGYDGYVSLECLALPDAETAAQKAIETLKRR
jgi:sugar phosphate isomerase/epimerase